MQISAYFATQMVTGGRRLTLSAMRMIRLVRLRERTSLLVEALETTCRAVSRKGTSSAADRAEKF